MKLLAGIVLLAAAVSGSGRLMRAAPPCDVRADSSDVFGVVQVLGTGDSARFTVCLVPRAALPRLGGYNGVLSFADSARLLGVEHPSGGMRIENTGERGRVSFAGLSLSGLDAGLLLTVTVALPRAALTGIAGRLTLKTVNGVDGRDVTSLIRLDTLVRIR